MEAVVVIITNTIIVRNIYHESTLHIYGSIFYCCCVSQNNITVCVVYIRKLKKCRNSKMNTCNTYSKEE